MAKTSRRRARVPYRPAPPERGTASGTQSGSGAPRRAAWRSPDRSGLPLLPITLAGVAVALLVIAFLALGSSRPSGPLATPAASYPAENPDGSLGSLDAKVTLQEWADFQCPACFAYTQTVEPRVIETYVKTGKLRLVFHDFPFIGPESTLAATAAQCAGEQHRFWMYHGYLYANQAGENLGTFTSARLDDIARAMGVDMAAFDSCVSGPTERSKVDAEKSAAEQAGVDRTPTLVIGTHAPITGVPSFTDIGAIIDAQLAAAGG